MPRLSVSEIRFQIKRALQELSRGTIRDLAGKPFARERALDIATDAVAERFKACEVIAPEEKPMDFGDMNRVIAAIEPHVRRDRGAGDTVTRAAVAPSSASERNSTESKSPPRVTRTGAS